MKVLVLVLGKLLTGESAEGYGFQRREHNAQHNTAVSDNAQQVKSSERLARVAI